MLPCTMYVGKFQIDEFNSFMLNLAGNILNRLRHWFLYAFSESTKKNLTMRNKLVCSVAGEEALHDALENVATTFFENKPFPWDTPTYLLCKKLCSADDLIAFYSHCAKHDAMIFMQWYNQRTWSQLYSIETKSSSKRITTAHHAIQNKRRKTW